MSAGTPLTYDLPMRQRWVSLALAASLSCLALGAAPAVADEMLVWDKLAAQTLRAERVPQEQADEAMALVHAAVDDAMNEASPMNAGVSADLAAAAAAHRVLTSLFPARKKTLDARLMKSFASADPEIAQQAYDIGRSAADAALDGQWKWQRPRISAALGPALPDQLLPSRSHLDQPMGAPSALKLHQPGKKPLLE